MGRRRLAVRQPRRRGGTLYHEVGQDRDYLGLADPGGLSGAAGYAYTLSRWTSENKSRGPLDFNYAFDDGSVRRINGVAWDDAVRPGARTVEVGDTTYSTSTANVHIQVPLR